MFEVPTAQGLTVCELVITDAVTRNLTLVNQFNRLAVGGFPSVPRRFTVVAVLVDGFGDLGLTLEVRNLTSDEIVFEAARVMRFPDRLTEVRFVYKYHRFGVRIGRDLRGDTVRRRRTARPKTIRRHHLTPEAVCRTPPRPGSSPTRRER